MQCPDCGKELHAEHYTNWRGIETVTYTCKTTDCLLNSVTLTNPEWQTANLENYRRINRAKIIKAR
jgi:hypothetical protein